MRRLDPTLQIHQRAGELWLFSSRLVLNLGPIDVELAETALLEVERRASGEPAREIEIDDDSLLKLERRLTVSPLHYKSGFSSWTKTAPRIPVASTKSCSDNNEGLVFPGIGIVCVTGHGLLAQTLQSMLENSVLSATTETLRDETRVDIEIVCGEGQSYEELSLPSTRLPDNGRSILFVTVDADALHIGPVVDSQTGCLSCSRISLIPSKTSVARIILPALRTYELSAEAQTLMVASQAAWIVSDLLTAESQGTLSDLSHSIFRVEADGTRTQQTYRVAPGCPGCAGQSKPKRAPLNAQLPPWECSEFDFDPSATSDLVFENGIKLDDRVRGLIRELHHRGAGHHQHATGSFAHHLLETWAILNAWGQPVPICRAGLFHSTYSTEFFGTALYEEWESPEVERIVESPAADLVRLFCTIDRTHLASLVATLDEIPSEGIELHHRNGSQRARFSPRVLAALLTIEMANVAEQAGKADLGPAIWMSHASYCATLIPRWSATSPPVFDHCSKRLLLSSERLALDYYFSGLGQIVVNPSGAREALDRAVALNPWVAEPRIVLASITTDDGGARAQMLSKAIELLHNWGTSWDKRFLLRQWLGWAAELSSQE